MLFGKKLRKMNAEFDTVEDALKAIADGEILLSPMMTIVKMKAI